MTRHGRPDPVVAALAAARREQGLTLVALSSRLGQGEARSQLSEWERGITSPTLYNLRRWADALGMDLAAQSREGA